MSVSVLRRVVLSAGVLGLVLGLALLASPAGADSHTRCDRHPTAPDCQTTTTTIPTTTTTEPIPETIDHGGLQGGTAGYQFSVSEDGVGIWWAAPYHFNLLYENGYGWASGDRISYSCMYGHLLEGGTLVAAGAGYDLDYDGVPVGRFFVGRIPDPEGEQYMTINDKYFMDGRRYFDGSPGDGSHQLYPLTFCGEQVSETYEPYTGPDERARIIFRNGAGQVVEIRDYRNTNAQNGVKFRLVDGDGSDGRVAVVAYGPTNLPGAVVYYDALGSGTVEADIP